MAVQMRIAGPPARSTGRRAARPRRRASLTPLATVLALLAGVLVIAPVNQLSRAPSAAAVTADPVIAAAGDMACGQGSAGASCREMATSDLLVNIRNTDRLDAVIPLGDVQYECGEIENFMLNDASNPPRGYDRSWGRVKSITRPVVGNHEYRTDPIDCLPQGPGAPGYFGYFGQAASPLDANCTASCKGYYSYDLGSWHLITLNSNCGLVPGGCGAGSPQETWLRNDLASTARSCVMAAWHHPRYSTGPRASTSTQALWAALYDAHADVVLTGHEHSYERFDLLGRGTSTSTNPSIDPQGVRQFVVGTGGRNHSTLTGTVLTGSQVRDDNTFGVLKMVLHQNSYDWQFVPISGQTFTDSGSTACHDNGGDTTAPGAPGNLAASAAGATQVNLSWTAATDNVAVTGYQVYRGGALLATVGAVTSYADTTVAAGTAYSYTVKARDAAGNVGPASNAAAVNTPVGPPPGTFLPEDARVQEASPATNYGSGPAAAATTMSTKYILNHLPAGAEHVKGYDRSKFSHWADADGDGCNTRDEVLIKEAAHKTRVGPGCSLNGGSWWSAYDGVKTTDPSTLAVAHMIPLNEAWQSGAWNWSAAKRKAYANDLGYQHSLIAVSASSNRSKGEREPQDWMPTRAAYTCLYAKRWVAVKWRWKLKVNPVERAFLQAQLKACDWPRVSKPGVPVIPAVASVIGPTLVTTAH